MSMSNKTTNELFNVGKNEDTLSLFDFNANFEKADNLIKALQDNDKDKDSKLETLQTTLNNVKSNVDTLLLSNSELTRTVSKHENLITELSTGESEASKAINELNKTIPLKQDKIIAEVRNVELIGNWAIISKKDYLLLNCYSVRDDTLYSISGINKRSAGDDYTIWVTGANNATIAIYCIWAHA